MHSKKKILVLPGPKLTDTKSLHYAISLAERIYGQVILIELEKGKKNIENSSQRSADTPPEPASQNAPYREDVTVSRLVVREDPEKAISDIVRELGVDVVVFDADDERWGRVFSKIRAVLPNQIIEVREKDSVNYF